MLALQDRHVGNGIRGNSAPSLFVQALNSSVGIEVGVDFRPKDARWNFTVEKEIVQWNAAQDEDSPNFALPLWTLDYFAKFL